jgi:plastocyanin
VTITASGIAFTAPAVTSPRGRPPAFDNQDASVHPRRPGPGTGAQVFKTDVFPGVATRSFEVPALAAGTYPFACTVHANMTGTLTAQ